jgi:hypothetical protein
MYQWLDRAPRGRDESGLWRRRDDEHEKVEPLQRGLGSREHLCY